MEDVTSYDLSVPVVTTRGTQISTEKSYYPNREEWIASATAVRLSSSTGVI